MFDESENNNEIKLFKCSQCRQTNKIVTWKAINSNINAMCQKCWNTYSKRVSDIRSVGY